MIRLGDIISEEIFLNSYHTLRDYYSNGQENVIDVNLRLIKPYFSLLSDQTVKQYYKTYVKNELVFALPELSSSEPISVPKHMTGVREYRFMSAFSHILYNSVGIVFAGCSVPLIESLDFKSRGIFAYFPTRFIHNKKEWKVRNKYREEYSKFSKKIDESIEVGNVVIKIDISGYFENISHEKLVDLLFELSPLSSLREHNIKDDARENIEFYLDNLMQRKLGIPQGRKNFTSDFFGYFYLIVFDNEIRKLCKSNILKFKAAIRYVDDTIIVFETKKIDKAKINKDLLRIEQKIASWLFDNLMLNINPAKTRRQIVRGEKERISFVKDASKSVSLPENKTVILGSGKKVDLADFKDALHKFKFTQDDCFNAKILSSDDRESLKYVFSTQFKDIIKQKTQREAILSILKDIDIELTVDEINILLPMFFDNNVDRFENLLGKLLANEIKNLNDRRLIHIILVATTKLRLPKRLKDAIAKCDLSGDTYAQYLPVMVGIEPKFNPEKSVYNRISNEYLKPRGMHKRYMTTSTSYNKFVYSLTKNDKILNEALLQALKLFQFECAHSRWDTAFNQLQNIFHELMKSKYKLGDKDSIQNVASKLDFIDSDEELLLRKFYDRRNFNPISHPSKKGLPAEKVNLSEFMDYRDKIVDILNQCLKVWGQT